MSSAICFNLDLSKILLCGNGLSLKYAMPVLRELSNASILLVTYLSLYWMFLEGHIFHSAGKNILEGKCNIIFQQKGKSFWKKEQLLPTSDECSFLPMIFFFKSMEWRPIQSHICKPCAT